MSEPAPEDPGDSENPADGLNIVAVRQPGRDCYKCKGQWKNLPGCQKLNGGGVPPVTGSGHSKTAPPAHPAAEAEG